MEIVGEFLGFDQDKAIWQYFKQHWSHFFPEMPDRTNFARQAANLHVIKRMLQEKLAGLLGAYQDQLHIIDGLPIPICKFARAYFSHNSRHVRLFFRSSPGPRPARARTEIPSFAKLFNEARNLGSGTGPVSGPDSNGKKSHMTLISRARLHMDIAPLNGNISMDFEVILSLVPQE